MVTLTDPDLSTDEDGVPNSWNHGRSMGATSPPPPPPPPTDSAPASPVTPRSRSATMMSRGK